MEGVGGLGFVEGGWRRGDGVGSWGEGRVVVVVAGSWR